ncbi:MAG TPA: YciI family protein [Gammaproteobacteria bacterium]|nr:YciI family protein [Gammaproteobacteria bacterium]
MNDFAFVYRGWDTSASPEDMQKTVDLWRAWFKDLEASGHLKDPGLPLDKSGSVIKGTRKLVSDGPFAEAKDVVGGFTLITAQDLQQATDLARGCPILESGGSIEVRPVLPLEM